MIGQFERNGFEFFVIHFLSVYVHEYSYTKITDKTHRSRRE